MVAFLVLAFIFRRDERHPVGECEVCIILTQSDVVEGSSSESIVQTGPVYSVYVYPVYVYISEVTF